MEIKWITCFASMLMTACVPTLVTDMDYETAEEIECGYNVKEKVCDLTLMDQNGDNWNLYDNLAEATVIDLSVMWCAPCQHAAEASEDIVNYFGKDKVQWVTILIEDTQGNPPDLDDLQSWASAFHDSSPILAGNRGWIDLNGEHGFPVTSWPTFFILDEDKNIRWILKGWGEQQIRDLIENVLSN